VFRPVSDNRRSERIELTASHLVLTIPPDTVDPDTDSVVDPPVLRLGGTSRFAPEVVDRQPEDMRNLPLRHADIVVAGGRGVGGPEGFRHIELLADALNGTVAASRVATDLGWIDRDRLVGQTGETVIPRLYVACGISGQSQHLIGMKDSETIVAINQDPSAPIVAMADIAAIGDLAEVIPAAVAELVDPS
jgi:electron transfer flavoprotein alpha subunit